MRQGRGVRISQPSTRDTTPDLTGDDRPAVRPCVPGATVRRLSRLLAEAGSELRVVHGAPEGGQADRGDARAGAWSVPTRVRAFHLRGHELHYRSVLRHVWRSDVVIAELASTNLDTYLTALLFPRKLMLWGHGKAYVTDASALDTRLELWLARRAQRVFVYTDGGAAHLRSVGYDAERLTVVRNSTDTVALRRAESAISGDELEAFRRQHDLGDGPVACFIGSFDESKGLPLLFAAAELVYAQLPDFRLSSRAPERFRLSSTKRQSCRSSGCSPAPTSLFSR